MKILFCSDGSVNARKALRFGARIAAACGAEPSVLAISEEGADQDALLESLRCAQDAFKEYKLDAELITKKGRAVNEIVKRTMETHYDMVVIGAEHKNPFLCLLEPFSLSVRGHEIVESVEPPVLVVAKEPAGLRRMVLCTGGAAYFEKAIEFAGNIAKCANALVDLFHVVPEVPAMYADLVRMEEDADLLLESNSNLGRSLRHQKELLEQLGVFGQLRLRQGAVVPELLKELQKTDYDLVVCGSMASDEKLRKYIIGDTARDIVNCSELPVLVVRTRQKHVGHLLKGLLNRLLRRSGLARPNDFS